MSQLLPMLEHLVAEVGAGRPAALCAVVAVKGSTPQTPGAAMLVDAAGRTHGTLGGGCVEADVRRRALELLHRGESSLLEFVLDHDYGWDDGLICGGKMTVGVATLSDAAALPEFRDALARARRREPAAVPVRVAHEGRLIEYRVHLETPPTLLIAGAGHVGQAVARLAVDLDFHAVVIDDREDLLSDERFDPRVERRAGDIAQTLRDWPLDESSYVVIVTRGHQHDHQALEAVVRRPARYIGLIGSRRKSRMILEDLRKAGVAAPQLERVHTPIGLAIDAVTVSEIAVSIAAQLVQTRRAAETPRVEGPLDVSTRRS